MPRTAKSIETTMPRKEQSALMPRKGPGETMLLKPCDTILKNSSRKRRVKSREVKEEVDKAERMLLKPCDTIPKKSSKKSRVKSREVNKLERMLLKPCDTIPKNSSKKRRVKSREAEEGVDKVERMLLKSCDMTPKNSSKKRRVKSREVEVEEDMDKVERMLLKSCDMTPKNSSKKRRVKSREVEEELEVEEDMDKVEKMLLKLCDPIPENSSKKTLVKSKEVEEDLDKVEREEVSPIKIEVGEHVDLKALLSSKIRSFLVSPKDDEKVPVSSLDGKYVLVCCFFVPHDKDEPTHPVCRSIEALYSELSLQGIADNVKLVVVVKMAPDSGISDFDRFFSKLSVDCLAIPFFDFESRDNVCESLDLCTLECLRTVPCLAVHPDGKVLQLCPFFLNDYGARSFPFTQEHFESINLEDEIIKLRLRSIDSPIFLGELLQCDSLSQIGDENKSIPTSDLDGVPVGLYLCYDGFKEGFMPDLQDIYQKCLDKGRKFEIVLVPLPFERHYNPKSFCKRVRRYALKDSRSSSWWTFPFNDKICRTLWRIFHCYTEDQLIILPHAGRVGDLWGRHVASFYGIDAYPFTRDVIVERKVRELRSVTLGQLLGDTFMSDFHKKNVLFFFDRATCFSVYKSLYRRLNEFQRELQVKYPDVKVVFVPFEPILSSSKRKLSKMGWHLLPPEVCESVIKHIFMAEAYPDEGVCSTLATFDKDGMILSRPVCGRLPEKSTSIASLFDDTLGADILKRMKNYMH
ncbi:putative nucleoredoxin 1 [Silene latifolia]|uniref:putative nucleoredoxin 1 n=1 Tax=Silene latifolia TaxID=37657 RepID=UPI003D774906